MSTHGKDTMVKMRPSRGPLVMAVVVLLLGVLFLFEGHRDPGDIPAHNRSRLAFAASVILSGLLFIVATGRMWFKHLWHARPAGKKRRKARQA